MDTFEDVARFTQGQFVVVRLDGDYAMAGVVASVDAASRTLTFTDGRQAQFPPPATDSPAEEPKEEANG